MAVEDKLFHFAPLGSGIHKEEKKNTFYSYQVNKVNDFVCRIFITNLDYIVVNASIWTGTEWTHEGG